MNVDALGEALDRFSQFFICPLISKDAVEREVKAVNSECASSCACGTACCQMQMHAKGDDLMACSMLFKPAVTGV